MSDDYSSLNSYSFKDGLFSIGNSPLFFDEDDSNNIPDNKYFALFDSPLKDDENFTIFDANKGGHSVLSQPLLGGISTDLTSKLFNNLIPAINKNQEEEKDVKIVLIDNDENKEPHEKNIENNEKYLEKKRERPKSNSTEHKINKKCGRKRKIKESNDDVGNHTKFSQDNMITKIKVYIINSTLSLLNNSFIHTKFNTSQKKKFIKINPKIYSTNKKEDNVKLLNTAIRNILYNDISRKNFKVDKNHNKILIDQIESEKENKEINIIRIFNLTFGEFLNFFRGTESDELKDKLALITNAREKFTNKKDFLEKTKEQEIKKGESKENIDSYIQKSKDVKSLLLKSDFLL